MESRKTAIDELQAAEKPNLSSASKKVTLHLIIGFVHVQLHEEIICAVPLSNLLTNFLSERCRKNWTSP